MVGLSAIGVFSLKAQFLPRSFAVSKYNYRRDKLPPMAIIADKGLEQGRRALVPRYEKAMLKSSTADELWRDR